MHALTQSVLIQIGFESCGYNVKIVGFTAKVSTREDMSFNIFSFRHVTPASTTGERFTGPKQYDLAWIWFNWIIACNNPAVSACAGGTDRLDSGEHRVELCIHWALFVIRGFSIFTFACHSPDR